MRNSLDQQLHEVTTRIQFELECLKEIEQKTKDKQLEIEEEKTAKQHLINNFIKTNETVEIGRELEIPTPKWKQASRRTMIYSFR